MVFALLSLSASSFLSATLLPGSSEAAFLAYLFYFPESWPPALLCVGISNTAGSLTSYGLARLIPHKEPSSKAVMRLKKYGSPALFFSFLPVIGDALPLAAGWLNLPLWRCAFFIALGKFTRYAVLLAGYFAVCSYPA